MATPQKRCYTELMKKVTRISLLAITMTAAVGIIVSVQYFNRVPVRATPSGPTIVSPASGRIIHIETVSGKEISFFKKEIENTLTINDIPPPYTLVVIELSLEDVHVQRAPIEGKITYQEHFEGAHKNALSSPNVKKLANMNEKNIIVIKNDDLSVGVIQVAGIAARRIQSFVDTGEFLDKGQVYGRILLGSQVVLIIPDTATLLVQTEDELIDGETVIAEYAKK